MGKKSVTEASRGGEGPPRFERHVIYGRSLSLNQPFANLPLNCPACDDLVYRYSVPQHYAEKHQGVTVPSECVVSEAEKKLVKEKNFKSKLAMSAAELSRLPDEQLALFPANEFWDAKKHAWKSTKAGVWAKSSSVKMKRVFGQETFN